MLERQAGGSHHCGPQRDRSSRLTGGRKMPGRWEGVRKTTTMWTVATKCFVQRGTPKILPIGAEEVTWWLRALDALAGDQALFPAPTWWLTTIFNSRGLTHQTVHTCVA